MPTKYIPLIEFVLGRRHKQLKERHQLPCVVLEQSVPQPLLHLLDIFHKSNQLIIVVQQIIVQQIILVYPLLVYTSIYQYIHDISLYIPVFTIFIHLIPWTHAIVQVYGGTGSLFCCSFQVVNMTVCTAMLIDIFSYPWCRDSKRNDLSRPMLQQLYDIR